MCGFACIVSSRRELEIQVPLLRMLAALRHRGPDSAAAGELQLESGWRVGLAHARLAILDTSNAGLQPMATPDRNLWTVFNGEIYNHLEVRKQLDFRRWRTGTDTETILHAWNERGDAAVQLLRGMFGICLLDVRRQRFWVMRDRLGIKPVYFAQINESLILIASELRSILASGLIKRTLDTERILEFLSLGAVTPPSTLALGIERLHPAESKEIDLSSSRAQIDSRRYWSPPFVRVDDVPAASVDERINSLKVAFEEAASNHLLSDVPVGVFLSGGIDSGAIVEAVTRRHRQVETFSVAFTEQKFDESALAEATARRFGTRHRALVLSPAEMLRMMPDAFRAYDTPSFDGVNTWLISKVVREAGVKVALSGLGGDELFAGYSYHRLMAKLGRTSFRLAARAFATGVKILGRQNVRTLKLGLAAASSSRVQQYVELRRIISPSVLKSLRPGSDGEVFPAHERHRCELAVERLDAVNAFSLLDMRCYMQNTLLQDADQMSMAHGMELRVPFLDHVVVEEVARLPGSVKLASMDGHQNKSLLLKLLERPLPVGSTEGKKRGFVFPWDQWLRHELKDFMMAGMENRNAISAVGLNETAVLRVASLFQKGNPNVRSTDILCLLTLLNWVERVIVAREPDTGPQLTAGYASNLQGQNVLQCLVI